MLRGNATHYLSSTLELGPEHSGTTFASYTGEHAVVSGGTLLPPLQWSAASDGDDEFFRGAQGAGVERG